MKMRAMNLGSLILILAMTATAATAEAQEKVVNVFILAGQSNMEGHGKVEYGRNPDYDPTVKGVPREIKGGVGGLRHLVTHRATAKQYHHLIDSTGAWVTRDDVWIYTTTAGKTKGKLTVGFGKGNWFGPEFGFGHVMGDRLDDPVLIIKTAWGGHDLGVKFRSPSSGQPNYTKFKFQPEDVGSSYRRMMALVKDVTGNLVTHFPDLKGYQVRFAGFGWHQGWNDGCADELTAEYESNLVNFIKDVRKDLGVKDLPFVIANTGQNGPKTAGRFARVCAMQMAVADPEKYPQFKGNVKSVDTRGFYRPKEVSPSGFGYHWNHNGETHYLIGQAMGNAMAGLMRLADAPPVSEAPLWKNPVYQKNIRATIAASRAEEPGWNLWIPHHKNRARWVTEKEVDLLMVGDSIVFRWSRTGKKVWEEYYSSRNAVNIGSSGDRTQHMLWHIQNGGLDGLKDRNPKLVVLMIGTNNRGAPELKGRDTAYGVLALLKELHARLPRSKILLLAVFPRGSTPENPGRIRNHEINQIIQTYADGETVIWADINSIFLDDQGHLKKELMPDGLHPSEAGYRAWAKAMEPLIRKYVDE